TPLTVSVSARRLSADGANHSLPYHARTRSRASPSASLNGNTPSGRNADFVSSYGTSCADPQNSQFCAWRAGSRTDIALQLWHRTWRFSVFHPRCASVMPRSALTKSCSTTEPPAASVTGDSVPQNGHTIFCFAGFQTDSPPHAGHANFCSAVSDDPHA